MKLQLDKILSLGLISWVLRISDTILHLRVLLLFLIEERDQL